MSLDILLYRYVVKNVCQASLASLPFVEINAKSILPVQLRIFVIDRRYSLVHELRVMVAVELHLNAAYTQHLTLKSVYEKSQYIMGGKLFSSRTVFELGQDL